MEKECEQNLKYITNGFMTVYGTSVHYHKKEISYDIIFFRNRKQRIHRPEIVMPENYIALFSTPTEDKALHIIEQAESAIDSTALYINNGDKLPQQDISFGDKVNSGIVNDLFYPIFVHAKKFYATNHCISCGKCVNVCPLKNISIENGKPKWDDNCTHCMACICKCPKEAIEYGQHSKGLPRYVCSKQI